MDSLPLEPEHYAILVNVLIPLLVILSGVLAAFRRPKREFVSILGWLATLALTFWSARLLFDPVKGLIRDALYAELIVILAPLAIGIFIFWVIGSEISKEAAGEELSIPGRIISFVFGLVRGGILVSALYMAYSWRVPIDNQPDWFRESRFIPHMQKTASLFAYGMGTNGRVMWDNVLSGRAINQGLQEGAPVAEPATTTAPEPATTTAPETTATAPATTGTQESSEPAAEQAPSTSAGTAETQPASTEATTTVETTTEPVEPPPDELQQIEEPPPDEPPPDELQKLE